MAYCFIYTVARDFGFAPNPFHGVCTLATCKPTIRRVAQPGDWVIGMGGKRLGANGRLIFAMCVAEALTFDEYWADPRFRQKRPVRNGSRTMMLGDNIYHRDARSGGWQQADSHHSQPDGRPDIHNVSHDTGADRVLIGDKFVYFGNAAPEVPEAVLEALSYKNGRGHRKFSVSDAFPLLHWLHSSYEGDFGKVLGDPIEFADSAKRYSSGNNRLL